jgi:hypothetical protein
VALVLVPVVAWLVRAAGPGHGAEYPVKAALRSDVQALIGKSWHVCPGGSEAYSAWLQVSRMRWRSSSLSLCETRRGLPLRRS